jgi:hypothetical protein
MLSSDIDPFYSSSQEIMIEQNPGVLSDRCEEVLVPPSL